MLRPKVLEQEGEYHNIHMQVTMTTYDSYI